MAIFPVGSNFLNALEEKSSYWLWPPPYPIGSLARKLPELGLIHLALK
jgi:hypothetical protein